MTQGVFSRNHRRYLELACRSGPCLFRSARPWASAAKMLAQNSALDIWLCANGRDRIEYHGTVEQIVLQPTLEDVRRLCDAGILDVAARCGRDEGTWGGDCKTLYVVRLRSLNGDERLAFSDLAKRDATPLSQDYRYAYALVRAQAAAPAVHREAAPCV